MSNSRLNLRVDAVATGSRARATTFKTLHNEIKTPIFMPVGTQATVKAQQTQSLADSGARMLLANTYHLLIRPGPEVFRRLGGIQRFMSWEHSVLTDSGGFQIFSLENERVMTEEGALFKSYLDGSEILLSPELSIDTQMAIGSDIMMVLDQCIASTASKAQTQDALDITLRWALRSLAARNSSPQSMFAIVQGALFPDLRRISAESLTQHPFDGFAIGGLAVGEGKSEREDIVALTTEFLPEDRPRYLMGVGTPLDILEAVHRGVDMFDCIIPTQVAQRGAVFTSRGYLQLRRSIYKYSEEKLDPDCSCPTCARYCRAYLHHLIKAKEILGWQLLGQHNIFFYQQLTADIRQSIIDDSFLELYNERREFLHAADIDNPPRQAPPRRPDRRSLGAYTIAQSNAGFASIQHIASGEIMHSRTAPMDEARRLYIDQANLEAQLMSTSTAPLVIWDVGLGAATNAMAAVECYEKLAATKSVREMRIISFENDLDSLRLAQRNNCDFPYLRHAGPASILQAGRWKSKTHPGLSWELIAGDFPATLNSDAPSPSLIFFDMFSHKSDHESWSLETFTKIFEHCQEQHTEMFTYSRSTAVRATLLAAGFYVASGCSTGDKAETTIALTQAAALHPDLRHPLLGDSWLQRWQRSTARIPTHIAKEEHKAFENRVWGHQQFCS